MMSASLEVRLRKVYGGLGACWERGVVKLFWGGCESVVSMISILMKTYFFVIFLPHTVFHSSSFHEISFCLSKIILIHSGLADVCLSGLEVSVQLLVQFLGGGGGLLLAAAAGAASTPASLAAASTSALAARASLLHTSAAARLPAFRSPLSWRPLGPGWGWGGEGLLDLGGAGCHGDLHGPSVQGDSVVLLESFDGVGPPVEDDVGGAQGTARPVIVDRGSLQVAELGEQLCDVRVADAKVQVGHDQLAWATC